MGIVSSLFACIFDNPLKVVYQDRLIKEVMKINAVATVPFLSLISFQHHSTYPGSSTVPQQNTRGMLAFLAICCLYLSFYLYLSRYLYLYLPLYLYLYLPLYLPIPLYLHLSLSPSPYLYFYLYLYHHPILTNLTPVITLFIHLQLN
ncbi:UNVERIFIED_CONTAM: hypothetical protein FKN15_004945 [Acipenser sinensis]